MKLKQQIKIHLGIGECLPLKDFCAQMGVLVFQPAESVECAMSFILEEQGLVEAMETYCGIVEIVAY